MPKTLVNKVSPHPLEGKHIIYKYGEQDSVGEGWALALFRLNKGILHQLYHPADHVFEPSMIGGRQKDELVALMLKKEIREVFSVYHHDPFFGIPREWFETRKYNPGETVDEWAEYESLTKDDEDFIFLAEKGITVKFYDSDRNVFF
ncbi:MAG: hypothetical protein WCK90_02120 [archaeon]